MGKTMGSHIKRALLDELLEVQNGRCFYCCQPLPRELATLDHIVPRSCGGACERGNIVVCCSSMNSFLANAPPLLRLKVIMDYVLVRSISRWCLRIAEGRPVRYSRDSRSRKRLPFSGEDCS